LNSKLTTEQAENRRLKAHIKRLEMETDILKKVMVFFANETKYAFISQYKNTYPINLQCRVLGISRQGYYHYTR